MEADALKNMARLMAEDSSDLLQILVEVARSLCNADSAGISIEEVDETGDGVFRWHALTGVLARYRWGTTPRKFSPCGIVLDRCAPQLFGHPGRFYEYLDAVRPEVTEVLLVPFFEGCKPTGTVWVVNHDPSRHFDTEDLRCLESICAFVSSSKLAIEARSRKNRNASAMIDGKDNPCRGGKTGLSQRQQQILFLAANGLTDKEIALRLGIGTGSVKTHWVRMRAKHGVSSRSHVIARALSNSMNEHSYDSGSDMRSYNLSIIDCPTSVGLGIWDLNVTTGLINCSPECKLSLGLNHNEDLNLKKLISVIHPDDRFSVSQWLELAFKRGSTYHDTCRVLWPDRTHHRILARGYPFFERGSATTMGGIMLLLD